MRLTLLSPNPEWINLAKENGYQTYLGRVQDYVPRHDSTNIYYISPACVLGFMDSGIDKVYSQIMFKGIESKIKTKIKKLGFKTKLGRPFIPIGKAIVTKTDSLHPKGQSYLITSPAMLIPQDISKTPNAFLSIIAVIQLLKEYKHFIQETDELIIPSMCCGRGKMEPKVSVAQIIKALESDVTKMNLNFSNIINVQPNYYENTEWKDISVNEIIKT
jgi:hypothetical protein